MASRSGEAIIRITAVPDSGLNRALNGAVDAARRTSQRVAAEEKRVARERERVEKAVQQSAEREAKKTAAAKIREAERAAQQEKRTALETERYKTRVAEDGARLQIRMNQAAARETERNYRSQIREAQRAARETERTMRQVRDARRSLLAGVIGAGVGAATGAVGLLQRGQSVSGVGSLEERLQVAAQFRQGLIRTGGEAGVSDEDRKAIEGRVIAASEEFGISILDIGAALTKAQQDFNQFIPVSKNLELLAKAAAATGEPISDLVGVLGNATRAFDLDAEGQKGFLDALISTSAKGSINVGSVSRDLAGQMGVFKLATGRGGEEGAREFLALTQVLGQGGVSAPEVETMIGRLTQKLQSPQVQDDLSTIGVHVTQGGVKGAPLTNFQNIASQFATNEKFQRPAVQEAIFGKGEVKATQAARILISALQRDENAFGDLQFIAPGAGEEQMEKQLDALRKDPSFRAQLLGVRAQAETTRDADRLFSTMGGAVSSFTELQLKYPLLTESFNVLKSTVIGLSTALIANRLAFGSLARRSDGATTAIGGLGTGVGAAVSGPGGLIGAIGKAGSALIQGAATFTLAYQGTRMLLDEVGITDDVQKEGGSYLYDLLHGETPRVPTRGFSPAGGSSHGALKPIPVGDSVRLFDDDLDALADKIAEGNRKDPATVMIKIENGQAKVTSVVEGDGLHLEVPDTGRRWVP